MFFFLCSLTEGKSPKSPSGAWTLLPAEPSGSIYHICKPTQAGPGLDAQWLWDQGWGGTVGSQHLLSHGIFLSEQWPPPVDGKAHSKVICVRGEGARKRSGTCHASCRNTLRSFENSFFGMCDEFRIQDQAHIYSKDLYQLVFFLCVYSASGSCDRAAWFEGCQDRLLPFYIASCHDEQYVQMEARLFSSLT